MISCVCVYYFPLNAVFCLQCQLDAQIAGVHPFSQVIICLSSRSGKTESAVVTQDFRRSGCRRLAVHNHSSVQSGRLAVYNKSR